jgi:transmembrane sensor
LGDATILERCMMEDTDWARLARYHAGECDRHERTEIERWIAADPARRALADSAAQAWEAAQRAAKSPPFDVDRAWHRLGNRQHRAAPRTSVPVWIGIAAVLLVGVGLAVFSRTQPSTARSVVASWGRWEARTITTTPGQRTTVDLGEGIQVTLGVSTTVRVIAPSANSERVVELDGEAQFDVQHDERRPFLVRAHHAVVRDVGTAFAVRAYAASPIERVRVVVTEGVVAVFPPSAVRDGRPTNVTPVTVRAGHTASLVANDSVTVRASGDVTKLLAWTEGKLVFDNATLAEVAEDLERWYGARVRLGSPAIAGKHYSATFSGESLDDVVRVIAASLNLRVERSGDTITLHDASISRRATPPAVATFSTP